MTAAEFLQFVRDALAPGVAIEDYLNGGGQGALFRGKRDEADVAVKVFNHDENPERVIHEIEALADLDSPYLIKALDGGMIRLPSDDEVPYMIYEYLDGPNLCAMVGTQPPAATLVKIGRDIGEALETLWEARIVHRDVKPGNIVQLPDRFVLIDIGLAKHLDRSGVTHPHHRPGTQGYMSPEQWSGQSLSIRADIFALGVTLYEVASGVHPFGGVQARIGSATPKSLADLRVDLPAPFCRFVAKMMAARSPLRPRRVVSDFEGM
jgi:eukaryotic-like serine/threonine-protein kinase